MDAPDETFDFVIVGSGGGSMCAALAMRAAGRSVLIVEKTELVGGTTARSGGVMWIPCNRFMARDGVPDSFERASAYLDALVGDRADTPGASRERRSAYLRAAPEMVDFLVDQGIRLTRAAYWPDYYDEFPGASEPGRTVIAELFDANELGPWRDRLRPNFLALPASLEELFHLPHFRRSLRSARVAARVALRAAAARVTGRRWVTAGGALQGRMLLAAVRAGVGIRTGLAVDRLIETSGRVAGVEVRGADGTRRIAARLGVLVNAGGFSRNQAMRDRYQPGTSTAWTSTAPGDTGEMIVEMQRLGAAVAQMEEMVGNQSTMPPGAEALDVKPGVQPFTASPHVILVDRTGVRYMNEGGSYMAYCRAMLERDRTVPAVPSWAIFDARCMKTAMVAGTLPGSRKPKSWTETGYLRQGTTIAGLARAIGVDPATLTATVDRFNGFAAKGRDEDFGRGDRAYDRWLGDPHHRPSPTLGTIVRAPFYAIPIVPGDVGTYGGVVTDVHARVLREDGGVIPGLYATGISTAAVMGRVYPGAGSSVGPSFVWGWVAARHALAAAA